MKKPERIMSLGEEIANSVTHGIGLVASLIALPVLVIAGLSRGDLWLVVGFTIFAVSMIALYAASTTYHALPHSPAKRVARRLDHAAIYLLIAGTYTPFTLGVLRGGWGWLMLGIIWSLAILGVLFKTVYGVRYHRASTVVYVLMGWLALLAAQPLLANMPVPGIAWLVAGGLLYTGGVVFFVWKHLRYSHMVWHLFVLGGTVCHFIAVFWYSAPRLSPTF